MGIVAFIKWGFFGAIPSIGWGVVNDPSIKPQALNPKQDPHIPYILFT